MQTDSVKYIPTEVSGIRILVSSDSKLHPELIIDAVVSGPADVNVDPP